MPRTIDIKKLLPRHNKILDLCLEGWSLSAIAVEVDISIVQLKNVRNSPCFQHELATRRLKIEQEKDILIVRSEIDSGNNARQVLEDHQGQAADCLVDLMETGTQMSKFKSAESILDRTGLIKVSGSVNQNQNVHVVLSPEDVDRLISTMELDK